MKLFIKQVMANRYDQNLSFNETHGRMVNGKFLTYKQIEQAKSSPLRDTMYYFLLGFLLFSCIYCFYQIDYKKRTQEEVLKDIKDIEVMFLSNSTIESVKGIKTRISSSFEQSTRKIAEFKWWPFNSTESINPDKQQISQSQSLIDAFLGFPVTAKNYISSFFQQNPSKQQTKVQKIQKNEENTQKKVQIVTTTIIESSSSQKNQQEVIVSEKSSSTKIQVQ